MIRQFVYPLVILIASIIQPLYAEALWTSNNIYLLHGSDFVVDADKQTTLTLEHSSSWSIGDVFFFSDFTKHNDSQQSDSFYGELSPRFSLNKNVAKPFEFGVVSDVLLASTVEFGKGDVESFMIGPAFDFKLPGFDYFSLNVYKRFTRNNRDGETFQVTPVWGMSRNLLGSKVIFEGYIDWNINNDGNYHNNIHFNPRLKYQLDNLFKLKNTSALIGLEYSYWDNKYGIKDSSGFDTSQSAMSLFLNLNF